MEIEMWGFKKKADHPDIKMTQEDLLRNFGPPKFIRSKLSPQNLKGVHRALAHQIGDDAARTLLSSGSDCWFYFIGGMAWATVLDKGKVVVVVAYPYPW